MRKLRQSVSCNVIGEQTICIKWCGNNTKHDAYFCKRIPYNTVYKVWRDVDGAQGQPEANRSLKLPKSRRYNCIWKLSYFLWHREIFLHWIVMWTIPAISSTTTYRTTNQSDLQGKYKLWSFCNALLTNHFVFHVAGSRWRCPSEGKVVIIWGFA